MQTETKLTSRLVKVWRLMGVEVLNIQGGTIDGKGISTQSPGWPDVFVCGAYYSGFIEFKGPKTKLAEHQRRIVSSLECRKSPVWIVRFLMQEGNHWRFQFEYSTGEDIGFISESGNDGQVAAKLLQALGGL